MQRAYENERLDMNKTKPRIHRMWKFSAICSIASLSFFTVVLADNSYPASGSMILDYPSGDGTQLITKNEDGIWGSAISTYGDETIFALRDGANWDPVIQLRSGHNSWINGGNLGIGTTTPSSKLHVFNDVDGASNLIANFESLRSNSNVYLRLKNLDYTGGNDYMLFAAADGAVGFHQSGKGNRFVLGQSGNVGIGVGNPSTKLEVQTAGPGTDGFQLKSDEGNYLRLVPHARQGYWTRVTRNGDAAIICGSDQGITIAPHNPDSQGLRIAPNGNVGIAVANPQNKLDVAGTIRAKEIIVASDWADFVFEDNYELMPLKEIGDFIQTNGHLPGIPSKSEVTEGGVSLGEMNAKLLQKVEELTLYALQQEETISELKAQNDAILDKLKTLEL